MALLKIARDVLKNPHIYDMVTWAYGKLTFIESISDYEINVYRIDVPEFSSDEFIRLTMYGYGFIIANAIGQYEFIPKLSCFSSN